MAIITASTGAARALDPTLTRQLFAAPQAAGRKITAGFTYLQRITKPGNYEVWFPDHLRAELDKRIALAYPIGPEQFPAQWAAVRQFELLQEAGNHKIYDLDPGNLQRATLDLSRSMRAGGIRITVATLGTYADKMASDELEILDLRLQERIARMIHMLYLDAQSEEENAQNDAKLAANLWDYRRDLPHIGMCLGSYDLFKGRLLTSTSGLKNENSVEGKGQRYRRARQFFEIINALPQEHVLHDTAIGLQLPELNGENQWNYIASPDETLAAFNRVMGDLFDKFNHISLARLHDREGAGSEIKASTLHLRSYGHPLRETDHKFYRSTSLSLH